MTDLAKTYRRLGVSAARTSRKQLYRQQAAERVYDDAGNLTDEAARRLRSPEKMGWGPSSTQAHEVLRSGTITRLSAYATTAPSTGDATITVTQYIPETGLVETIATVTILEAQKVGRVRPLVAVAAGVWIAATVTDAKGASGVSTNLTIGQE